MFIFATAERQRKAGSKVLQKPNTDRNAHRSVLFRLLRENISEQRWIYFLAVLAMIATAATTALTAWLIQPMIDVMTAEDSRYVVAVALGVFTVFAVKGIAGYVQTVALTKAGSRIVAKQQRHLFEKLLSQGVAFFDITQSSGILLRFTQSARAARSVVEIVVTSFIRDLLTLLGLIAVMFYQQPMMSLVTFLTGPVAFISVRLMMRRLHAIVGDETKSLSEIVKVIQETARGIHVVKVFGLERRMQERLAHAVKASENRANSIARVNALSSPITDGLMGAAVAAVVLLGAGSALGNTAREPGQLMSFIAALLMAYDPAKRLLRVRLGIETDLLKVGQMYALLDTTVQVREAPDAVAIPAGPIAIALKDIDFAYQGGKTVLRDFSLDIPPGKITAIVGPSGGGKSTVINLLMRLYDPDAGSIEINGVDLRRCTFASLRSRTTFVSQNAFLFSGTVRENLSLGNPNIQDKAMMAAAMAADAHDFIMGMPQGYDSTIGEAGGQLSGGQKQRLAIARALLRHSDLLILDEPTSALDPAAERNVVAALRRERAGQTTLIIAHRLSTVIDADLICDMEEGHILEQGTADELVARKGAFARLFDTDMKTLR